MQIILPLIYLFCIIQGQQENSSYKNELSIGLNTSNYISVDNKKLNDFSISYYRIIHLHTFDIKYGINRDRKRSLFSNKYIRSDDFDGGTTLYLSDINSNMVFYELNTFIGKEVFKVKDFHIFPIIGLGLTYYVDDKSTISYKETYYQSQTFTNYDYRFANEAHYILLKQNTSFIYHLGLEMIYRTYVINMVYSKNMKEIERLKTYLVLQENLQSLTIKVGKRF